MEVGVAVNPIDLDAIRISLVSTETLPGVLAASPPRTNLPVLSQHDSYVQAFAEAASGAGPFKLPWPTGADARGVHWFWHYYLKRQSPDAVQPETAWRRLVPLRSETRRLTSTQAQRGARAILECFCYPHGSAVVATMTIDGPLQLEDAVDRLIAAATALTYSQTVDGTTLQPQKLGTVIMRCLERMAVARQGAGQPNTDPFGGDPFSVTAVVRGQGVDPTVALQVDSLIHRALEAFCSLRPTWRQDLLPPIDTARVPTKFGSAGTTLYAQPRARVLWFPELFTYRADPPIHKIGCFNRNLTFAAMQTQSLLGLARWAAASVAQGESLAYETGTIARNCATLLGMIYGKVDDMYRSRSLRRQIDDSGLVPTINQLRAHYGFSVLA
jgi:hypothetical protein